MATAEAAAVKKSNGQECWTDGQGRGGQAPGLGRRPARWRSLIGGGPPTMQVTAFSSPANPSWRRRIVNYAGETVAESHEGCPIIAAAVAQGTRRLIEMTVVDRSAPVRPRWTSYLRGR